MEADDLIQELQTDYLEDTSDRVKNIVSGYSNLVQMSFADTYFPLEFIQNADDERAGSIRFQIREIDGDWCLEILNDGREFTEPDVNTEMDENEVKKDVSGLCAAGQSPKSPRNHIGFMGVGFKSIFEISNHVEIHSGEFDFEFNRERAQHQGDNTPWRVIPFDSPPTPETEVPTTIDGTDYKTRFVIHLNEERKEFLHEPNESVEENTDLFDPLDSSNLDRRVFLFLKNLQEISIHDEYSNTYRHMQRNQPTLETGPLADAISKARETFPQDENQLSNSEVDDEDWNAIDIVDISEQPADEEEWEEDRWTVFKHLWKVPSKVSEDKHTERYMRSDVEHREVFIAGLVDEHGGFRRPEDPEGTVHTGVFSYLPLKELETDFNFLVHADFLTPPDRQNIKRELLWNQKIAQGVVDCLTDVLEMLAEHDDWWVELEVFTPGGQGNEFIVENLIEPVHKYLRTKPLTRDTDGEFVRLDDCRLVSDYVSKAFSADELEQAGSTRAIHSSHEDVYKAVFPQENKLNIPDIFEDHDPSVVLEKDNSPAKRLQIIYNALSKGVRSFFTSPADALSETGVLLDDGNVIGTDDVDNLYFPPDELDLSEFDATPDPLCAINEQLNIVDRTLASDNNSRDILEQEAETLTTAKVITQWLDKTDWSNISKSDRLLTARLYCETHNDGGVEEDDISLRLKTTSGEWERPEKLFMPAQCQPDDPVQKLKEFDWVHEETVRKYWNNQEGAAILDGGPKFVSDEYLSLSESLRAKEWRELFYQLGVDKPLHDGEVDRNLIGCLGELYVYSQLGESSETNIENVHVGRDIVEEEIEEGSRVPSPKRIIEVKSTKDADKGFDLSASQTKVLEKYDDKYFIYRVTEVLEEPQIHVASANDVDAAAEKKFTLGSAAWQSISTPYEDHT